jgi:hypothetical protein
VVDADSHVAFSTAAFEYHPCFVLARRIRSIPSAVFGPVLSPP